MLNVTQVMARLNVGKSSVYGLVRNGLLPKPVKVGGSARWIDEEVEAAIEAMKAARDAPPPATRRGRPRKVRS
jgi:predicted DNA-binding transcriptional regulator AlpA